MGKTLCGRYRIDAVLGVGGMGIVYAATHRAGNRVAIKYLDDRFANDADALTRFRREAYVANRIEHPGALPVLDDDVDEEGGVFLVMPLLSGETVRARWERMGKRLPESEVVEIALAALDVLAAAHATGIVHRDIKPENLFLTTDARLIVFDFGIARVLDARNDASVTRTGIALGTPAFMAPEQAIGRVRDIAPATDVWAMGATMFTLLSGRFVHECESANEALVYAATRPVRPSSAACNADPRVLAIIDRALAFHKEGRWRDATEMKAALTSLRASARVSLRLPCGVAVTTGSIRAPPPSGPGIHSASTIAPSSRGRSQRALGDLAATGGAELGREIARRRSIRRRTVGVVSIFVVVAAIGSVAAVVAAGHRTASSRTAAMMPPGGESCTSSAACTRASRRASVCRAGACVALESQDCTLLAEKDDTENDDTIWLGTMFPMTGEAAEAFGMESVHALDLGRRELASIAHGIPSVRPGGPARPIALVTCDDAADPRRAARHLAEEVKVPAVIGFHSSQEVIDLAMSEFIPHDVLAMATLNRSSLLATIPQRPGEPRLVWRTTIDSTQTAEPVSKLVSEVIEPDLRSGSLPVLTTDEPMRVAFLHPRSTAGLSAADALFSHLRFNGRSAVANGKSFRDFPHADAISGNATTDYAQVAQDVAQFAPHVIVYLGFQGVTANLLEPIEKAWPARARFRPRYVANGYLLVDEGLLFVGKSAERRARFFAVNQATNNVVNAKMTARYNESYSPKVSVSSGPAPVYDAFYLLAYAMYAANDAPLSGTSLARGIARLVPPGSQIDVGPTTIFDAFNTLRKGENADLEGATGSLDFDLATGDWAANFAVLCVNADASGSASEVVESGVFYDVRTMRLEGLPLRCP